MLTGEFNIQLKNASSGTVVKNITLPAVITDFYKYESTSGFPFMSRYAHKASDSYNAGFCANTAIVNASGIKLFKATLNESPHKFKTTIDDEYCGFATRYTDAANAHQFSDKAGYMSDYAFSSIDFRKAEGERVKLMYKWTWPANKGNGTINAVGTGHQAGVNAVDKDPLFTDFNAAASQVGMDFYQYGCLPVGNYDRPVSTAFLPNASENTMTSQNNQFYLSPFMHWRASVADRDFYYQTDANIVHIWFRTLNELNENNEYVSVACYRVINKKWMYKYCLGMAQGMHPLNTLNWYAGEDAFPDNEISINSGAYPLRVNITLARGANNGYSWPIVEDNAYCIFFADAGAPGLNPNPDGENPTWADARPQRCYVILGDTPELRVYNTQYDSLLTCMDVHRYTYHSDPVLQATLFCKDFSYILIYHVNNNQNLIIRRFLSGDSFVFKTDIGAGAEMSFGLCFLPAAGTGTFCLYRHANTANYTLPGKICNISDGQQVAYALLGQANEGLVRSLTSKILLDGNNDSPYKLTALVDGDTRFSSVLATNFLYAKANLPEPITKTSDYTLDITFTLHIY